MATLLRYVNTAPHTSGDGTTNGTGGGGTNSYVSLAAAIAGLAQNLTGVTCDIPNVAMDIICTGATADTTAVTVDGFTTDTTHRLRIRAAAGDVAVMPYDTGRYRLEVGNNVIALKDDNVTLQGLQLYVTGGNTTATIEIFANTGLWIERCLLRGAGGTTLGGLGTTASAVATFVNCVCYGFGSYGAFYFSATATFLFDNCTCAGTVIGWQRQGATTVTCNNCIVQGATTNAFVGTIGGNYNLSNDTTAPGANSQQGKTLTFVNAAGKDYHLASGDTAAIGKGANLSADGFTDDFDAVTRSGAWDIGADQHTVLANIPAAQHYLRQMGSGR